MPLALGFQIYPWVERVLKVRQYPLAAHGLALLLVAIAMLVRTVVGHYAGVQIFTTFYPAVIVAALVGAFGRASSQLCCPPWPLGISVSHSLSLNPTCARLSSFYCFFSFVA